MSAGDEYRGYLAAAQRLERRAIVEWLRRQTVPGAPWAWNDGCCPSIEDIADAIEKKEHHVPEPEANT